MVTADSRGVLDLVLVLASIVCFAVCVGWVLMVFIEWVSELTAGKRGRR